MLLVVNNLNKFVHIVVIIIIIIVIIVIVVIVVIVFVDFVVFIIVIIVTFMLPRSYSSWFRHPDCLVIFQHRKRMFTKPSTRWRQSNVVIIVYGVIIDAS